MFLIEKYHLPDDVNLSLIEKLDLLKHFLREEIRKELKIKDGALNFRRASNDGKSRSKADKIVKEANSRLLDLNEDLCDLDRFIVESNNHEPVVGNEETPSVAVPTGTTGGGDQSSQTSSDREDISDFTCAENQGINGNSQSLPASFPINGTSTAGPSSAQPVNGNQKALHDMQQHLTVLEKRMNIEIKVKQGAENMIQLYGSKPDKSSQKMVTEAQQMFEEAKTKIEYIRMQIVREKHRIATMESNKLLEGNGSAGNGSSSFSPSGPSKLLEIEPSRDIRIEELRHRLRVECAVVVGAKNVIRLLESLNTKTNDKSLLEAKASLDESSKKLDLIRKALEFCRAQLPPDSEKSQELKSELENSQTVNSMIYSPSKPTSTIAAAAMAAAMALVVSLPTLAA